MQLDFIKHNNLHKTASRLKETLQSGKFIVLLKMKSKKLMLKLKSYVICNSIKTSRF